MEMQALTELLESYYSAWNGTCNPDFSNLTLATYFPCWQQSRVYLVKDTIEFCEIFLRRPQWKYVNLKNTNVQILDSGQVTFSLALILPFKHHFHIPLKLKSKINCIQ